MGDLGKLLPYIGTFNEGKKVQEWRVPIVVFDADGDAYKVTNVYEDEGFLCIDIEIPKEDS